MIILGIDPGTATTGYGAVRVIDKSGQPSFELIEYGCIVTAKDQPMPMRLFSIQKELNRLIQKLKPDCVVVEQLFFGINSRTAMTVGQARGVVLSTIASFDTPIFEYQGLHVKHTMTGNGRADKKEVQKSVMKHLGKRKLIKPKNGYIDDAADALAVAICHVLRGQHQQKTARNPLRSDSKGKKS